MQLTFDPAIIGCVAGETALTELDDIEILDRMYRARLLRFVAVLHGRLGPGRNDRAGLSAEGL